MKKKLLIVLSFIFIILIIAIIVFYIVLKRVNISTNSNNLKDDITNSTILNIIENIEEKQTNAITEEDTSSENLQMNSPVFEVTDNSVTESTADNVNSPDSKATNVEVKSNTSNSSTSKVTQDKLETNSATNSSGSNIPENKTEDKTPSADSTPSETPTPEDNSRPELAYSTYRVTNNTIVPEIISILKSEISKDKELVDFGTTAVSTNKTNAYNNTNGFTYLFVKDITKGKISGNYQSFPERVRNTVGAFGTYYVYAEDEYTYDARGLNPKWSQTLVWIYVKF